MTRDAVSVVAKSDELIVAIGDSWYRRSRGNPKAKYYASQHMRLMARLLMHLRDQDQKRLLNSNEKTATHKLSDSPEVNSKEDARELSTKTRKRHSSDLTEQNSQGKDVLEVSIKARKLHSAEQTEQENDVSEVFINARKCHSPGPEEQNRQGKDVPVVSRKHHSAELDSAELIGQEKDVSDDVTNTSQHHSPEAHTEGKPLWDFIVPQHFDDVVFAALQCALPYMDDTEELASPTNAIRLKYDIIQLVDCKWALIQTTGRGNPSKDANACDVFHRLLKIKWGEHVTKLARTVLLNRSFSKEPQIPSPKDMKKLTCYVVKQLLELKLTKTSKTFRRAVQLSQSRLLIFNKRRSG